MENRPVIEQMKSWLGNGEFDIDAMIRYGATTESEVVNLCLRLIDSPWYLGSIEYKEGTKNEVPN